MSESNIDKTRIKAARRCIASAGGPAVLACLLTRHLGVTITRHRVAKWREIGVPAAFGVVLEHCLGRKDLRIRLNPHLYTDNPRVINRFVAGIIVMKSAA